MIEPTIEGGFPERLRTPIDIQKTAENQYSITLPHVELPFGASIPFSASVEKLPFTLPRGEFAHAAFMDLDHPTLDPLKRQAEALTSLPEEQRPRKLIELIRSQISYPYKWVMEELKTSNPERYEWVNEKLKRGMASLSECAANGLAQCDQFAAMLSFLGEHADLESTIATYGPSAEPYNIKNVYRQDNGQPLFKSIPPETVLTDGHGWVEFRMPDGIWMPADPATQLVGDTPEGLATFAAANYHANLHGIYDKGLPISLYLDVNELALKPGESNKTAPIFIRGSTVLENDQWVEQNFSGSLAFEIRNNPGIKNDLPVNLTNLSAF